MDTLAMIDTPHDNKTVDYGQTLQTSQDNSNPITIEGQSREIYPDNSQDNPILTRTRDGITDKELADSQSMPLTTKDYQSDNFIPIDQRPRKGRYKDRKPKRATLQKGKLIAKELLKGKTSLEAVKSIGYKTNSSEAACKILDYTNARDYLDQFAKRDANKILEDYKQNASTAELDDFIMDAIREGDNATIKALTGLLTARSRIGQDLMDRAGISKITKHMTVKKVISDKTEDIDARILALEAQLGNGQAKTPPATSERNTEQIRGVTIDIKGQPSTAHGIGHGIQSAVTSGELPNGSSGDRVNGKTADFSCTEGNDVTDCSAESEDRTGVRVEQAPPQEESEGGRGPNDGTIQAHTASKNSEVEFDRDEFPVS